MRRSSLRVLDTIQVASPCSADWELMVGDDRQRFCKACEKHVYNLPMLSAEELVDLIERTEGKFCGRLYARTDGTVLTNDCPVGLAAKLAETRRKRVIGAAAAVAALMISAGGAIFGLAYTGTEVHPVMAGEIAIVQPPPVEPIDQEVQPQNDPVPEPVKPPPEKPPVLMGKIKMPDHRAK